jgi:hypothetical protein
MNRKLFFIVIVIAAVIAGATVYAQQPPHRLYNAIMKDVAATFPSLKKNLDGTGAQGVDEKLVPHQG